MCNGGLTVSDDERRMLRLTHWLALLTFGAVVGMLAASRWDDLAALLEALTGLL